MKKTLLSVVIAASMAPAANAELIISKYVEGSANNKAIELTNIAGHEISLDGYQVALSSNGKGFGSHLDLSGRKLPAGGMLVIANPRASKQIIDVADIKDTVTYFNGNDPVAVFKDGVMFDVVGDKESGKFGVDKTLIRKSLIPSTRYNPEDWESKPKDYINGLGGIGGLGGVSSGTETETTSPQAIRKTIPELQGEGWESPFTDVANRKFKSDETFVVEGVITAVQDYLSKDLPAGIYIQDMKGDGNPKTSDGIFVATPTEGLHVGDVVDVTGPVEERYGWTMIPATSVAKNESKRGTFQNTIIERLNSDVDFDATLERYEGMAVELDSALDMRLTNTFGFDYGPRRYNAVLSQGQVNVHPNQHNAPVNHDDVIDTDSERQADCNQDKKLIVETLRKISSGSSENVPWLEAVNPEQNYVRIGDGVTGLTGVIGYSYGDYRLFATNTITSDELIRHNPRTDQPVLKEGGDLRVASFNVLNYFTSDHAGGNPNPFGKSRGAKSFEEFELQGDKIAVAIAAMDADIVGLMEVENNGFDSSSAIHHLVAKINASLTDESKHYVYISPEDESIESIGTDVITNHVIYRANKLTLEQYRIIPMPQQHAPEVRGVDRDGKEKVVEDGHNYQRESVSPTFKINGTDESITVSVNHFKSKGSSCWEDAAPKEEGGQGGKNPDNQGNCEAFRVSASYYLGEELAKIDGHKIILGDLNSYASEDPVMVLTNRSKATDDYVIKAARDTYIGGTKDQLGDVLHKEQGFVVKDSYGYISAVSIYHPYSYSYVYSGETGTLDYLLMSSSLMSNFVDAIDWNINAAESKLLEYANKNNCKKGTDDCSYRASDHYRSSDHDPAILDLDFGIKPETGEIIDVVGPDIITELPKPISPPSKPVNPPADITDIPQAPAAGEPIKALFDLTALAGFELRAGDTINMSLSKMSQGRAYSEYSRTGGGDSTTVALTRADIEKGWAVASVKTEKGGEFELRKSIHSASGKVFNYPVDVISVAESDTGVDVVTNERTNRGAGSTGLFSLFGLALLAVSRRFKK